jgi:hypothetical protein
VIEVLGYFIPDVFLTLVQVRESHQEAVPDVVRVAVIVDVSVMRWTLVPGIEVFPSVRYPREIVMVGVERGPSRTLSRSAQSGHVVYHRVYVHPETNSQLISIYRRTAIN